MAGTNPFQTIANALNGGDDKRKPKPQNDPPVTHLTVAPGGQFDRTKKPIHDDADGSTIMSRGPKLRGTQ